MNISGWKTNRNSYRLDSNVLIEKSEADIVPDDSVILNSENLGQKVIGFGGTFSEMGWAAIKCLNSQSMQEILNLLFTIEGCNFSVCKTPIGASDFALEPYSLDDDLDDYDLRKFNISRDKKYIIPFIKEAQRANQTLKLFATPWSPPYWMKTNGNMCCGGDLINSPELLKCYAEYIKNYIFYYNKQGIDISAICPQNDVEFIGIFPSSTMTSSMMRRFIRGYLLPIFIEDNVKTEIWVGTIGLHDRYAYEVLDDTTIRRHVKGIAFQHSTPNAVKAAGNSYNQLRLVHSEACTFDGQNTFDDSINLLKEIIQYINCGCTNFCYGNMVSELTSENSWGVESNSLITVDKKQKIFSLTPSFYIMKHFSSFVLPGASKIDMEDKEHTICFKNPDESIVIIYANIESNDKKVEFIVNNQRYEMVAEKETIYTLRIEQ